MTVDVDDALRTILKEPANAAAWEAIASDVYQPLLAYVASLLITFKVAPAETADDIVHEVLLSFYKRWSTSKARVISAPALHAYLRVSCRNLLIDRYRRERNAERFRDFATLRFDNAFQGAADHYRSIALHEIIETLPPDCASFFRKFLMEDLSLAEIADQERMSPSMLYSRWYRCIEQAKKRLAEGATSEVP